MALLTLLALSEGAGKDLGPFKVEGGLTLWTWVVFLTLFFVLKRFAWPAILKSAEEREQTIQRQLSEAERLNAEARTLLLQQEKAMAEARSSAQSLLAEAKSQSERERAIADLRLEAVDLSLAAASRLVGQRLDSESDRNLVTGYLASLETKN